MLRDDQVAGPSTFAFGVLLSVAVTHSSVSLAQVQAANAQALQTVVSETAASQGAVFQTTAPQTSRGPAKAATVSSRAAASAATQRDVATEVLASCDFGVRSPEAPEELDQFAFLIGNYDVQSLRRQPDGTWAESTSEAYWEGRWILGGTAIADYWYDQQPLAGANVGRGVNVRMFRPESGQWTNMWQHSAQAQMRTLMSEVRADGFMHMWAVHPDTSDRRRLRFETTPPDQWVRVEEWSQDGGKVWFEVARLEATRSACPWQP